MGCPWSKCCSRLFGSKNGEFDPDHHIMIQSRDENRVTETDFEMSFKDRTSIENPNALDVSDGCSVDPSPSPNRRMNSVSTTNSTVTVEAAPTTAGHYVRTEIEPSPTVSSSSSKVPLSFLSFFLLDFGPG